VALTLKTPVHIAMSTETTLLAPPTHLPGPSRPMSVLIADDQPHIVEALRLLLKPEGYDVETADSPRTVLARLGARQYDLLLLDLNYARDTTSGGEGLDLVGAIRRRDSLTPIVVMTAWGGVSLAVAAMQRGACDVVIKPWDNDRLVRVVRAQAELGRASRRAAELETALRQDLQLAAQVQAQLFPRVRPALETLDYVGRCVPARVVGGDYFDFVPLEPSRLGIALADVAGKGVSAALMMATLQALFRSRVQSDGGDPARLVSAINTLLLDSIPSNRFATFFYGVYDDRRRTLTFVNAGHNPAVLRHADGSIERLDSGDPVIGLIADLTFHARTVSLAPGDTLVLFSDGVTDAENESEDAFGDARLVDAVGLSAAVTAASLLGDISAAHATFVAGAPQQDDMTLVVARVV
jgi:sigma-B regulation protein RsbU (phosphoserine phosphatase)